MTDQSEIIFTELPGVDGNIGLITLNRQSVLNALNHAMFIAIDEHLARWDSNPEIKAVVINAVEGRAFCAGGDMRAAYEIGKKDISALPDFFAAEYRMNSRIYHFSKPYIALLDGITMGGGAGISINGTYRVATEKLVFAMPETGIGFFPDVGSSYFLSRLQGVFGIYLGLTGSTISCADCLELGLIDQVVTSGSYPEIIKKLQETSLVQNPDASISEVIRFFCVPAISKSELFNHSAEIETCFSRPSIEEIIKTLERYPTAWCEEVRNKLVLKSPTSLKVTLRLLQEGAKLTFEKALQMEYRLMTRFIAGHDLYEGVRALLIDKDNKPEWKPAKVSEVSETEIENYFAPVKIELTLDE